MTPPDAMIREIKTRLAAGWTFTQQGIIVAGTGPKGEGITINCDNETAANELLAAAQT